MTGPRKSKPIFDIKRSGGTYYVMRDGVEVAGPYHNHGRAEERLGVLEARAAKVQRKCMTCTQPFMSEGPHNRMCKSCRTAGGRDEYQIGA